MVIGPTKALKAKDIYIKTNFIFALVNECVYAPHKEIFSIWFNLMSSLKALSKGNGAFLLVSDDLDLNGNVYHIVKFGTLQSWGLPLKRTLGLLVVSVRVQKAVLAPFRGVQPLIS